MKKSIYCMFVGALAIFNSITSSQVKILFLEPPSITKVRGHNIFYKTM